MEAALAHTSYQKANQLIAANKTGLPVLVVLQINRRFSDPDTTLRRLVLTSFFDTFLADTENFVDLLISIDSSGFTIREVQDLAAELIRFLALAPFRYRFSIIESIKDYTVQKPYRDAALECFKARTCEYTMLIEDDWFFYKDRINITLSGLIDFF